MEGLDSPRKSTQLCSLCACLYLDSAAGSFEGPRKQIPLISLGVIIRYTLLPSDCPYGNKDPRVLLFKGQKNFHMNTDRKCCFFKKKHGLGKTALCMFCSSYLQRTQEGDRSPPHWLQILCHGWRSPPSHSKTQMSGTAKSVVFTNWEIKCSKSLSLKSKCALLDRYPKELKEGTHTCTPIFIAEHYSQ